MLLSVVWFEGAHDEMWVPICELDEFKTKY